MPITPEEFVAKWRGVELPEISASQSHFNDLCDLLEIGKPIDEDPKGKWFTFEKAVPKGGKAGGGGHADVWRKDCFVWEYKRKNTYNTLAAAIAQARDYAALLDNPPLVIACDINEIQIRTLFTGSVSVTHTLRLTDLNDVSNRQLLRRCFVDPQKLRPIITPRAVTEEAARKFATLAQNLRERRDSHNRLHDARRVAHFLNKIVFCLFAEDAGLLPSNVFSSIVEEASRDKSGLSQMLAELFDKMRTGEGYFGSVRIPWFNGGLFDDDDVLELLFSEIQTLSEAMRLDWASIEPVIFGTLFERGLDPTKRKEMAGLFDVTTPKATGRKKVVTTSLSLPLRGGATATERSLGKGVGIHYTDTATIMKIVEPVILRPLVSEWKSIKAAINKAKGVKKKDSLYLAFRERLGAFRVLDPACGSGAFLYTALRRLKDFDYQVELDGKALGVTADPKGQRVTPKTVLGIEINPYAAELARVTVWIGELQWQMANGYGITRRPILGALNGIENRDALIDERKGKEAQWPRSDVVVGNPPFLGSQNMMGELRPDYVEKLRNIFAEKVPGASDLVCFWFYKCADLIEKGLLARGGLVATNSIRGGANRLALERIMDVSTITDAWSDEPWALDGAAVRVSLVCFAANPDAETVSNLDGGTVARISSDLTGGTIDLTGARRLAENQGFAFQGPVKVGAFDIAGDIARPWLKASVNPNGRNNSDVLRPWTNGMDITRRPSGRWIVDFEELSEVEAALYEAPFEYLKKHVFPARAKNKDHQRRQNWWRLGRSGADFKRAAVGLTRVIISPRVSKYRLFVWRPVKTLPDSAVVAITKDDDVTFGVLQSRPHELWSLRLGTWLGVGNDPRYTPSTTFETYPFPNGFAPNIPAASYAKSTRAKRIAGAAKVLNEHRENWLNPPDLVKREPEVVCGYPERVLPKNQAAAEQLKSRTLTNLYNERPTWLINAHRDLDRAVAAAYGWEESLVDRAQPENLDATDRKAAEEEILDLLFKLNQKRSKAEQ